MMPNLCPPTLSRRRFLRAMALLGGALVLPSGWSIRHRNPAWIPLPPAIMLHSTHGTRMTHNEFFPVFVRDLQRDGYTTITYRSWLAGLLNGEPVPAKPVIITMDDLGLDAGNPRFRVYQAMHDHLAENGMVGVFAVITRPNLHQAPERWQLVTDWITGGFELATHTSQHTNFSDEHGRPRYDLTQTIYDAEIVDSAQMIEEHTGQVVCTLITPYGSGFCRATQEIDPGVIVACRQTAIKFVIGIPDGRNPTTLDELADPNTILYWGRTTPGPYDNAMSAIYNINVWYEQNYQPFLP